MPGRHDPEIGGDVHWRKLRLGQPHPVLLRHFSHAQHLAAFKKVLYGQQLLRLLGSIGRGEQRHHPAALPSILGRGHAGLAKQGLLGIGLRIGVFHRDAQGVQRIQRVAHRFNAVFRAHQAQLKHEKRLFAKMKCWHPFPGASM